MKDATLVWSCHENEQREKAKTDLRWCPSCTRPLGCPERDGLTVLIDCWRKEEHRLEK